MSIIKSIKQVLGLGPAAENHFWDGSVPNQLSLKRGTPDAPGTELMKFLEGAVSFPNQGQELANPGYVKLPGGLIVQWGEVLSSASAEVAITYPIPFPNAHLQSVASCSDTLYPVITQIRNSLLSAVWFQLGFPIQQLELPPPFIGSR